MNNFLSDKFEENIINQLNIKDGASILLAISGGQDSLCLLKLFIAIKMKYNLNLGIINIDHQWRNDTTGNTNHIINYIKDFHLPLYLYQIKPNIYSEVEARNLRYQIFINTALTYNYSAIATAHTSTDQIETCFQKLMRGSPLDSLNSILWTRKINHAIHLIRPILNFQRWEVTWLCRYFSLPVWSDSSNLSYDKTRNRIRHEFIPYIKYHLQCQIEHKILTFLENTSFEIEYIKQNTVKLYQSIKHPSCMAINYKMLTSQHSGLQLRILHLFFIHNTNISLPNQLLQEIMYKINYYQKINMVYDQIIIKNNHTWLYISCI